jgi:hypothetical protein
MAHFAKLNEDNIVVEVVVVNNETLDPNNEEQSGVDFLNNLYGTNDNWKQTSYNANFRKLYAGLGYTYDEARNAFIAPKPFKSWILNEETCCWEAPTPIPTDDNFYRWVEDDLNWQVVTPE